MSHANPAHYEPSNITFGIMEPLSRAPKNKLARRLALSERALADLAHWIGERGLRPPDSRDRVFGGRESTLEAEAFARGGEAPRAIGKG